MSRTPKMADSTAWAVVVDIPDDPGGWEAVFMNRSDAEAWARTRPPAERARVRAILCSGMWIPDHDLTVDESYEFLDGR